MRGVCYSVRVSLIYLLFHQISDFKFCVALSVLMKHQQHKPYWTSDVPLVKFKEIGTLLESSRVNVHSRHSYSECLRNVLKVDTN